MDFVEAARIQAMLDVVEDGFLYRYRRICRWYSQKFYTPLPDVEALPEEDVLRVFFETQFESMSKAERKKLAMEMTETSDEEKARKDREAETSDDAFLRKQEAAAAKEAKREAKRKAKLAKKVAEAAKTEMMGPEKPLKEPPPEISMSFDDDGNLMDEESIPLPPPRKR